VSDVVSFYPSASQVCVGSVCRKIKFVGWFVKVISKSLTRCK